MPSAHRPRDSALIDALGKRPRITYDGPSWRVVRDGRDVLQGSRAGGRWDDGTFDVLYTALEADGAVAEMHFHLAKGQPVFPSKAKYRLHELEVAIAKGIRFLAVKDLQELGVSRDRYGKLGYGERQQEYRRTQEIAEAAHFLGCDGLIAPNARWECLNLVVFTDRSRPETLAARRAMGLVDWEAWTRRTGRN